MSTQLPLFDLPPAEPRHRSPVEGLGAGLPDGTVARLTAAGLRLVGMTWNDHGKYWTYQIRGDFGGKRGPETLSKTAQGLLRTIETMEAKRR